MCSSDLYAVRSAEVYSVSDKSAATASSMMQSGTLARVIGGETLIPEVLYEGMPVSGNYAVDFDKDGNPVLGMSIFNVPGGMQINAE